MMAYFAAIRVWLVRPLQALGRATGVIATGDLAHRIPVARRDEFGRLGASINAMAASLAENQRRLLAAERFAMIGEMSAYVAHNIRNPLASIRTTAQAELLALGAEDPLRAGFTDIVTAADRLESWVGDLLRFASPVSLERSLESVNALVQRCAELTRPQLAKKGLRLDLALATSLAPVSLDRNKMEQVLIAVLANAMDASPAGGTIRVVSDLRQVDHTALARVRVEDQGSGIPPERLRSLFTLFATSKKSGTGLGLALAQKIVAAHDGTITVSSREGEGTAVEINLPAADTTDARDVDHSDR
jgi:two-component system sensor histidine kinase AtoS